MKLIIKKELLLRGINIAEHIIGRNLTLPILNNILLKTNKNKLNLIATDLELAILVSLPAKIEQEGDIVVTPKILNGFLTNIPEGNTELTSSKNTLFIRQNNYKTNLKGESSKEYPILPNIKQKNVFIINSIKLTEALNQIINSTAISDLKPELTGILFSFAQEELKLASTDSFRLSEKTLKITDDKNNKQVKNIILPSRAAQEIIKIYQNIDDDLYLYIDENQITIENNKSSSFYTKLISKLIEGEYPQYSQIIPQKYLTKVVVSRSEFISQIKSASLFAGQTKDILVKMSSKKLEIHADDYDVGEFDSYMETKHEGEEKEILLNYQYLLDGLQNIKGEEVVIKINQKDSPVLLEGVKNKNYLYVLMPIRGQ